MSGVAAALFERLVFVAAVQPAFARSAAETLRERWGVPLESVTGEEYLQALADKRFTVRLTAAPPLRPLPRPRPDRP